MNPEAPSPLDDGAAPTPETPIDTTWQSPLKQIRTYQGDIAEAIKGEHESLYSIRAAEKARSDLLKSQAVTPPVKDETFREERSPFVPVLLLIGGLLLLGGAGTAGYFAYQSYLVRTAVPVEVVARNRFLPAVRTQDFNTASSTRAALISLLTAERQKKLGDGNIEQIELEAGSGTAPLTNVTQFLLFLETRPSGSFVRSINQLFMLGIIGEPAPEPIVTPAVATSTATSTSTTTTPVSAPVENDNGQTFVLMKVDSYVNAYAGMLDWERNLKEDMLPLFHSADVVASVPNDAPWSDVTIKNKDARELVDASGKTQLIYSFYNQNLLIMTSSREALRTILDELDTQALAR